MILLKNGALVSVDLVEDCIVDNSITAIKTVEMLKKEGNRYAIKDSIYKLTYSSLDNNRSFRCIQSCFDNDDDLGTFMLSQKTAGLAINRAISDGYKVYINNKKILAFSFTE